MMKLTEQGVLVVEERILTICTATGIETDLGLMTHFSLN